jgi:23S rRNA pseudouridine2605 synthase
MQNRQNRRKPTRKPNSSPNSRRTKQRTPGPDLPDQPERIQKVLANAGLGSRREIESWIADGRIAVDGRVATLGDRITGKERILVNGRPAKLSGAVLAGRVDRVLLYYKPAGEVTTRADPEGRPTVFERLPSPRGGRWISVGRLDVNTMGLLLFTTDGELAHRLMHPSYEIDREYAVRLTATPDAAQLRRLTEGVALDDGSARFESIVAEGGTGRNVWYRVTLREGRNREVRRLFEAVGLMVGRLIRVRYGPVLLGRMRRGESRFLAPDEMKALYSAVKLVASQGRT